MRTLLCGLFSLTLIASATMLTNTDAFAVPGNNNGNHFGQINNGNNGNNGNHFGQINNGNNGNAYGQTVSNGNGGSVPIPGTLLLFGAGFAGLVVWQVVTRRQLS